MSQKIQQEWTKAVFFVILLLKPRLHAFMSGTPGKVNKMIGNTRRVMGIEMVASIARWMNGWQQRWMDEWVNEWMNGGGCLLSVLVLWAFSLCAMFSSCFHFLRCLRGPFTHCIMYMDGQRAMNKNNNMHFGQVVGKLIPNGDLLLLLPRRLLFFLHKENRNKKFMCKIFLSFWDMLYGKRRRE